VGTPERLAADKESATGQYLRTPLARAKKSDRSNGAVRSRRARVAVGG